MVKLGRQQRAGAGGDQLVVQLRVPGGRIRRVFGDSDGLGSVTITYHVVLPSWAPPSGVPSRTVAWWTDTIHETVAHEGHHITLYEEHLPAMNEAVRSGTCASVEADLERLITDAQRANCEFDLAEYGYALGLTLESCMAS